MEKAVPGNVVENVNRRLHPVRLSISHLNKILEGSKTGTMLNVNRDLLLSITSTMEIFLEDFEASYMPGGEASDTKSKDKVTEVPRVTQTRVS